MTEIEEIRESIASLTERQDKIESRVESLETRVTTLDSKMDTLLDGVSQIKSVLNDNTSVSKSARRNTRGWGFLSVLVSLLSGIARIIIFGGTL